MQGLMARRMAPPAVVLLELQPHAMTRAGYEGGALRLLRTMHSWGYTDVSHSGYVTHLPFQDSMVRLHVQCSQTGQKGRPAEPPARSDAVFTAHYVIPWTSLFKAHREPHAHTCACISFKLQNFSEE